LIIDGSANMSVRKWWNDEPRTFCFFMSSADIRCCKVRSMYIYVHAQTISLM
jgi:hypothetical protein